MFQVKCPLCKREIKANSYRCDCCGFNVKSNRAVGREKPLIAGMTVEALKKELGITIDAPKPAIASE